MELVKKLTHLTKQIIYHFNFKNQARKEPTDFTRNRKLSFEELILYMLVSRKCSTSSGLRRFFEQINKKAVTMTQQSLSDARKKVTVWAFIHLFRMTATAMTEDCRKKWHNYRVFAIDGSKIALPADEKLRKYFGALGKDKTAPTAQGSVLYDVLNDIVCDAAIKPMSTDERTLAKIHLAVCKNIAPNDNKLFIFDRGYASFELVQLLENKGYNFVMRVKSKFNKDIDAQTISDDYVCLEQNGKRIQVRVIRIILDSDEIETLITNITDRRLGMEAFKKLYFMRWPIEKKFDIAKNKLQLENFNTRTVEGIKQDFFAAMYLANIAAAALMDAQSDISKTRENKENKYQYKANLNELIGILKDRFVFAISQDETDVQATLIADIIDEIKRYVIPIRPKRSNPRYPSPRDTKFHHNQKVNC
jgi:hypothetical protein